MTNVIAHPTARRPYRISDEVKRVLRSNEYPRGEEGDLLTDAEFADFITVCEARQLDPLRRHIYATKRSRRGRKQLSVEATIDGLRLTAERTNRYRGQTRVLWTGSDGRWVDAWLATTPPKAAAAGVWRDGDAEPLTAVAHYDEFVQRFDDGNLLAIWREKPRLMLAKCAEALALRKAFPDELGGLYTAEELDRAEGAGRTKPASRPAAGAVVAGIGGLAKACGEHGYSTTVAHSLAHLAGSGARIDSLGQADAQRAVAWVTGAADAGVEGEVVLDAVGFAIAHSTSWSAAQDNLERWIGRKRQSAAATPAAAGPPLPIDRDRIRHVPLRAVAVR